MWGLASLTQPTEFQIFGSNCSMRRQIFEELRIIGCFEQNLSKAYSEKSPNKNSKNVGFRFLKLIYGISDFWF